jgi:hypothetical protein
VAQSSSLLLSLWLHSSLLSPGLFYSCLVLYSVIRTPWTGDQPVATPLPTHRTTRTHNKRTQTSMTLVGSEPTTPMFGRAKTVHTLDRPTKLGVDLGQERRSPLRHCIQTCSGAPQRHFEECQPGFLHCSEILKVKKKSKAIPVTGLGSL